MATKKEKKQTINNIQELNLEIDYDKLADAIAKAQEKSKSESKPIKKIGFWKSVWLIIRNKEPQNGMKTAYMLAEVMAGVFNIIAIIGAALFAIIICFSIFELDWGPGILNYISQGISVGALLFASFAISLLFRGIANEIRAEKDRNYIISVFSGIVGFAALIVALIALFNNGASDEIIAILNEIKDLLSK